MKIFSRLQQKLPPEFENAALLTIATGAITVTQQFHRVDTEASAASDDLVTINGTTDFKVLYIRPNNSARTVVVKHNAGNIKCFGDADITLDDNHDCVILVWDEIGSVWCALAASSAGVVGALLANASVAGTGIQELLGLNFTDPTELVIASGAITLTQGAHTIDTEANAASDDLDTITAAGGVGDVAVLIPENDARTVVLKHGTGNIQTADEGNIHLSTDDQFVILFRIATRWLAMSNRPDRGVLYERSMSMIGIGTFAHIVVVPVSGSLRWIEGEIVSAGSLAALSLILYVNGSSTGLTITIDTAANSGSRKYGYLAISTAVVAGDVISFVMANDGSFNGSMMGSSAVGPLRLGVGLVAN